ncbi:phosphoribosylamine--glycine ligase [Candidatus Kaiserbacteria bacterium]|nr:phosphoribosylamine--glycine ligase [Candidatus Kaiserbacteria bacterium]
MATDVLIVGSGGREHALAWKLRQSPRIGKLYIAPGNGGTRELGENVPIAATMVEKLADFAQLKSIDLTVVGPEDPLALGIVDVFQKRGLRIFGPSQAAAQIESSKAFSKQFMQEAGIPTAEFGVFTDYKKALKYVREKGAPIVVKASGLALGKGVYVCGTLPEAEAALKDIMYDQIFKDAGAQVVIEEFLDGPEVSIHAISDGKDYKMFPSSQDHKAIGEGDTGKNTGGIGTIAPLPWITPAVMAEIEEKVVKPTFVALAAYGVAFSGILYPGLMISSKGIKVLEFNSRFGGPECESYMRLMKSDLLDLLEACVDGKLAKISLEWNPGYACNIVLCAQGYPDEYEKGFPITGIEDANQIPGVVVFQAGTTYVDGIVKTSGGRVLGVSAVGDTLKEALKQAYKAIDLIHYEGKYFRRDIGTKSLSRS